MNALEEIIRQEISARGAIPFARFMELALYHPEHGYYERDAARIGRHGDYFTSVSVGSLFGELLAFQFAEWLSEETKTGSQGPLQIVEAGAHDGRLAADILGWLKTNRPEVFEGLGYWILEPSPRRRQWQEATLGEFARKVKWWPDFAAVRQAQGVRGVIFSNELLDAMPVHRLGWEARGRRWFEWGVGVAGGCFEWVKLPLAREDFEFGLIAPPLLPTALLDVLPDGYTIEVCPRATAWWRDAAASLAQGRLLTFDYGFTAAEWIRPERREGTLRAYRQHRAGGGLLEQVGEQDLTAHVNFSALQAAGEAAGLRTEGLLSQGQFLVHVLKTTQTNPPASVEWNAERTRQFHTLIHPDHLGRAFRVLVQSR